MASKGNLLLVYHRRVPAPGQARAEMARLCRSSPPPRGSFFTRIPSRTLSQRIGDQAAYGSRNSLRGSSICHSARSFPSISGQGAPEFDPLLRKAGRATMHSNGKSKPDMARSRASRRSLPGAGDQAARFIRCLFSALRIPLAPSRRPFVLNLNRRASSTSGRLSPPRRLAVLRVAANFAVAFRHLLILVDLRAFAAEWGLPRSRAIAQYVRLLRRRQREDLQVGSLSIRG